MDGIVVIGEGEKDEAPMLFNGEQVGDGTAPSLDIAVDPIDGTTLTPLGRTSAISVIAVERARHDVRPRPVRLHGEDRRRARGGRLDRHHAPAPTQNLEGSPRPSGEKVSDVTAVILDRDRHTELIAEVRAAGPASG